MAKNTDSVEFSPANAAPLGIPGNPLDGVPGAQDALRPRRWWDRGTRAPLQLPGRLQFQEMADVGTAPSNGAIAQEPQDLLTPDVVSATDPAYSMHPVVNHVLSGLSRVPASTTGGDSPWAQWLGKSPMTTIALVQGLRPRGRLAAAPYEKQGANDSVGSN